MSVMGKISWAERLWGAEARFGYLLIATVILLFVGLGGRELWTQEHRWADIVFTMMHRHDYLHPSLDGMDYYDKPLLSYWLIVLTAKCLGQLTVLTLRLPSALSGLLAVYAIYRLGTRLRNRSFGLLAGWLLLTTFYFVFWSRTSSADMMNVAGTLLGVMWYADTKDTPTFLSYMVFFLILAVTALCKGLVGPVVTVLAILPDLIVQQRWKKHLHLRVIVAVIPAAIVYSLPFWASTHYTTTGYSENGLYLVYRENILRYFQPFDHKGPLYTYFLYLPIYLLPWTVFFIPSVWSLRSRWHQLTWPSKWIVWSVIILFLFFTASGSRRSYYVLPMVPFAILMIADWLMPDGQVVTARMKIAGRAVMMFFIALVLNFTILQPFYYSQTGFDRFANQVQKQAQQIKPWEKWRVILLDPESKVRFYLGLAPEVTNWGVIGERDQQTQARLLHAWPVLANKPRDAIFITRNIYLPLLQNQFPDYQVITLSPTFIEKWIMKDQGDIPVAFIPRH